MDTLNRLRRANLETPAPDPPTPAADDSIRVYQDRDRLYAEIPYADWPQYQARGFRQLAPHERESDLPAPVDRGRSIFPPLALLGGSGQTGMWAARENAAREHLSTHADLLAARIDRPPMPRQLPLMGKRPPHPARAVEIAQAAITAEATALLWDELDSLREEVAALRAALKERG